MKKYLLISLALCAVIAVSACSGSQAAALRSFSFDVTMESGGRTMSTSKYYVKDGKMRVETTPVGYGSGTSVVMIFDGSTAYQYIPEKNMAMKITMPPEYTENVNKFQCEPGACDCNKFISADFKLTKQGTESFAGKACMTCEYQSSRGTMKMWIDKSKCRTMKMYTVSGGRDATMTYSNFVENPNLSDSLFQIPAGCKVMDMNSMIPGGMGNIDMKKMMEKLGK